MSAMETFNVHEASFDYDESDPEGYRCGMDRFGPKLGAAKIGATRVRDPARAGAVPVPLRVRRGVGDGPRGRAHGPHPDGEAVMQAG